MALRARPPALWESAAPRLALRQARVHLPAPASEIAGDRSIRRSAHPMRSAVVFVRQWIARGRARFRTWRLDQRAAPVLRAIDPRAFAAIRARYRDTDPCPGSSKYLDLHTWVRIAVERATALGLDRARRCEVLDLGTGCGY